MYDLKEKCPEAMMDFMEKLLDGPYRVVDILPEQVPANAPGQFFSIEQYFLQPERLAMLRRKFAEILLKLNCYYDMEVSSDNCSTWEQNPDPEVFVRSVEGIAGNIFLRAVFPAEEIMFDLQSCDIYMTVYGQDQGLLGKLNAIAAAEGLYVRQSPDKEAENGPLTTIL